MSSIEKEFDAYVRQEAEKIVKKATEDTEKVLKNQVQKKVYESYKPVQYNRTDNLNDAITSKIGEVVFDKEKLNHKSTVTNEIIKMVPEFLNDGHNDGGENMYHNYPARKFIEETINIMQSKEEYKGLIDFEIKRD